MPLKKLIKSFIISAILIMLGFSGAAVAAMKLNVDLSMYPYFGVPLVLLSSLLNTLIISAKEEKTSLINGVIGALPAVVLIVICALIYAQKPGVKIPVLIVILLIINVIAANLKLRRKGKKRSVNSVRRNYEKISKKKHRIN